ncbi:hypothetical protein [uncultured Methanobrevibacter sp.]|uniref:hypothetical protein n=1 Tax=uncultured Methanobrevibacter sp. TaxID=253161 RepID=UPI0025ECFDF7|nr:hypothetical protein [uncultured Methanobrevibacter sp.]
MESIIIICEFIIAILIYYGLFVVGNFIYKKLKNSKRKILNPLEYFPMEEYHTLNQVFYLIMMSIFFLFIIYICVSEKTDFLAMGILQIIISLYVALTLDYSLWKNKVLFFLLIPFESIIYIVFNASYILFPFYQFHIIVYIYLMKLYYNKFRQYTESNSLGITIVLLFIIVFFSFILTIFSESVSPLDSMAMVSNAFTSNGYAILGNTIIGKINAIILVWSGYILSGVGTATLTVAILSRHYKKHEEELNKRLDELEYLIKNK